MSCVIKHIMLVLAKDKCVAVNQCSATHRFITRPYEVMEKDIEG
jgi:hypothetical protein